MRRERTKPCRGRTDLLRNCPAFRFGRCVIRDGSKSRRQPSCRRSTPGCRSCSDSATARDTVAWIGCRWCFPPPLHAKTGECLVRKDANLRGFERASPAPAVENDTAADRAVLFALGASLSGEFVVEARFVPRNGGAALPVDEGEIRVPFVLAGDVAGHPLRLVWQSRGGDALTVADAAWSVEARAPGRREWVSTTAPEGLTARYKRVEPSFWGSVAATAVWLRHFVEVDGSIRTLAHYRLANPPDRFPSNCPSARTWCRPAGTARA